MPHKLFLGAQFNNWVIANDTEEKLTLLPHNFILRLCTLRENLIPGSEDASTGICSIALSVVGKSMFINRGE